MTTESGRRGGQRRPPRRLVYLGVVVLGVGLLMLAGTPAGAQPGHDHVIGVPVVFGPMILRVVLLGTVSAVVGFAMMRAFLPEPGRTAAAFVSGCAVVTVLLELMLADGLDMPTQGAVLVLAALGVPLFLALSRDPRAATAARLARSVAPLVVSLAAVLGLVEFGRAWLGAWEPGALAVLLHTGLVLAFVGLAWLTLGLPRSVVVKVVIQIEAAVVAAAALAGAAQVTVLLLPQS